MLVGEDCFEVIADNMTEMSRMINAIDLDDYEATKSKKNVK